MYKLLLILFLIILKNSSAQNCAFTFGDSIVCINNSLNFNATFNNTLTANKYEWNFGNGITSEQINPTYNYPLTGNYYPSVTITFTNNSQCVVNGSKIKVVALPNAKFTITTDTSQCFKYNWVCIKDSSVSGLSNSPIVKRVFLWGDGSFDTNVIFNQTICNNYKNTAGDIYSLVLEVTDSNGCITRLEKNKSIHILPKQKSISFTSAAIRCDTTIQKFINTSAISFSNVKKFTWDFGDGIKDSTNLKWSSFNHTYIIPNDYWPSLIVTDKDNCSDTNTVFITAKKKNLDNKISIETINKCYSKQEIRFKYKDAVLGDNIIWQYSNNSNIVLDTVKHYYTKINSFIDSAFVVNYDCGKYKIKMTAFYGNNCKIIIDTTFEILGPNTIFGAANNDRQCIVLK